MCFQIKIGNIACIPREKINEFLEKFNNFNQHIKFTIEQEENNCLAFLDVKIIKQQDGSVVTDWYHKNTWSGRYLNFRSWLPISYKINTISILTSKILKLSDVSFHKTNFHILTNTLLKNGYPKNIIQKTMKDTIFKHTNPHPDNTINPTIGEKIVYLSVPYIKDLFEKIKKMLGNFNIKTVGRANESLGSCVFSKIKDKTKKEHQSNVVYQVTCECGCQYTGQTKQFLGKRMYQHTYDSKKLDLEPSVSNSRSALSSHMKSENHTFDMNNVKILEKESNYRKRCILEMIHIKKSEKSINKQIDSDYIQNAYGNILLR